MKAMGRTAAVRRAAHAERQRAYRQRQRQDEAIYHVRVGYRVLEALLVSGRLSDEDSRDRAMVEAELGAVLLQWAEHWLK